MEVIGWFIFDYILVYCIYYVWFIRRTVRGEKVPSEANYLINLYNLDINRFSYRKFIKIVGLVTSFDVALVATLVAVIDSRVIWQILFSLIIIIPIIAITFMVLGKIYQNKQTKDNSRELEKEKKYLEMLRKKDDIKEQKKINKTKIRKKKVK